jgi:hypothetical protein
MTTVPNITYNSGLEINKLVEVVSYNVSDYYESGERHYHCIDAELLHNYLIATELLHDQHQT